MRPIPQLDGLPGFAEIFFDNVNVPVDCRLGDEGKGWKVAMATAGFERGLMLRSPGALPADRRASGRSSTRRTAPAPTAIPPCATP